MARSSPTGRESRPACPIRARVRDRLTAVRILCVTLLYPPHHLGGYERVCQDVLERLVRRGHDVTVLTSNERQPGIDDPADERSSQPVVRRDLISYHRRGTLEVPALRERLRAERHNQSALRAAIEECEPDVVTPWHMGALSVGLLSALMRSGRPLVYGVCDDWPTYVRVVDPWARLFTGRKAVSVVAERLTGVPCGAPPLGPSGTFCFLSETTRRRCVEYPGNSPWPSTAVVYTGIDLTSFRPGPRPAGFNWRLLYAGRPDRRKGITTLVRSLAYLPEATLTAYLPPGHLDGGDAPVAELRALAGDIGVESRVELIEGSGVAAMVEQYERSDVVVFPSEWPEPLGLVPVEAMACGVPVVATGVGGSGEYLVDGANAVLFEPGDAVALARAVTRVAGDAALRERLVAGGLRTSEQFDVERTADAYEAWFAAAAGSGPRPSQEPALRLPAADDAPPPMTALRVPSLRAAAAGPSDVRVGIVSWNTAQRLDACLTALPAALGLLRAEVVVVDNDSSDGSAAAAARHQGVVVLRNAENVGYAKAMNQALGGTDAPVLIALNPDTVPPPGSLATLVRHLVARPDVGLVAPRLIGEGGELQHSVYRWPSPLVALAVALIPPRWQRGRTGARLWLEGSSPHDESTDVDWVIGAVHVIRKDALGGAPPFDERWFIYVEDLELCWRLARRGWRRRLEADVEVVHVGGASTRQMWRDTRPTYFAATYDWYARDRGASAARRWAVSNVVGVAWRMVTLLIVGALTRSRKRWWEARGLRPMLALHLRVLRNGPPLPVRTAPELDARRSA